MPHLTFGAIADYVAVPEQRLARAPKNLDLLEAAALPVVGTTAMTALSGKARLQPGERLLVRGATGGVGSVAVQLGKALGAHVTALAAARNLDWITRLGADEAVDYRTTRPEDLDRFDVIVDVVGTDLGAYRKRLARGGRLVALSFDSDRVVSSMLGIALRAAATPRRVKMFSNNPSADRIAELTRAVEAGTIRPVVDTVFPMRDIAAVHQRLEAAWRPRQVRRRPAASLAHGRPIPRFGAAARQGVSAHSAAATTVRAWSSTWAGTGTQRSRRDVSKSVHQAVKRASSSWWSPAAAGAPAACSSRSRSPAARSG